MEGYNYNYQQIKIPNDYPIYENSINEIKSTYINHSNNKSYNYTNIEIPLYTQNQNEKNFFNHINNTSNITNVNYPSENYYINNNNEQKIKKIPNDRNNNIDKKPEDNLKKKKNLVIGNSLKNNNYNTINKINILVNGHKLNREINSDNNNIEKQPKDNYKKYSKDDDLIKKKIKNKNMNIKININDNNLEENNNTKINYLKTNENKFYEYNTKKISNRNSIKAIERIKKNNLISINDVANNKKNKKSPNSKDIKNNNIKNKTQKNKKPLKLKLNPEKKEIKQELNKNLSSNRIKGKSDSNFASLINQKKLKMFSSFRQIHDPEINDKSKIKTKPEKNISKNKPQKNARTIKLKKNNFGRLYSPQLSSLTKTLNKKQVEIKKTGEIMRKKLTNTNVTKKFKRNISYNIDNVETNFTTKKKFSNNNNYINNKNRASSFRTFTEKSPQLTERKKGNLSNRNVLNKNGINQKYNKNKIIRKQLSLRGSNKKKIDEKINKYERNTTEVSGKNIIYSRVTDNNNNDEKEVIVIQKKNLYSFMKKERKKEPNYSHDMISEEKMEYHNKSYNRFSSLKKLEEIKKKYKFFPHYKNKKNLYKDRDKYIDYIEESNIISKLMNSMDLNKSDEIRNLNLTEFLPPKQEKEENINNKENIKIMENEEYKEEEKNDDKDNEDILNRKSFILDLNNVIPINEQQLRDTINKQNLTTPNTNLKIKPKINFNNNI